MSKFHIGQKVEIHLENSSDAYLNDHEGESEYWLSVHKIPLSTKGIIREIPSSPQKRNANGSFYSVETALFKKYIFIAENAIKQAKQMPITRTFSRKFMREEILGNKEYVIEDKIVDNTRWSIVHDLVFKFEGKFYTTNYSRGATEQQDERPWEYEEEVVCQEVRPVEKTIIVYENINE